MNKSVQLMMVDLAKNINQITFSKSIEVVLATFEDAASAEEIHFGQTEPADPPHPQNVPLSQVLHVEIRPSRS